MEALKENKEKAIIAAVGAFAIAGFYYWRQTTKPVKMRVKQRSQEKKKKDRGKFTKPKKTKEADGETSACDLRSEYRRTGNCNSEFNKPKKTRKIGGRIPKHKMAGGNVSESDFDYQDSDNEQCQNRKKKLHKGYQQKIQSH
ncbi:unnamed protein product [Moneuplotes crassus]|uniref:Uncharacterized protein n=1 Tax=Euplotes crassus TaxID=5936 RepID=A0AAD1Y9Q4_EUPCR|nr:unnamed protein product [Moneuplotes crassus]CAI2387078.1 unnamed protein product [Moneuplotes crassus]